MPPAPDTAKFERSWVVVVVVGASVVVVVGVVVVGVVVVGVVVVVGARVAVVVGAVVGAFVGTGVVEERVCGVVVGARVFAINEVRVSFISLICESIEFTIPFRAVKLYLSSSNSLLLKFPAACKSPLIFTFSALIDKTLSASAHILAVGRVKQPLKHMLAFLPAFCGSPNAVNHAAIVMRQIE